MVAGEEFLVAPRILKARMAELEMSAVEVAAKAGVSEATVYRAITPGTSVSFPNTIKILAALGGRAPFTFERDGE